MDGKSSDIRQEQIEKLKELFPEAVSEGRIDWEKLRLTLGEDITIDNERYVLNWAGKSDAFRAIQTPTMATLKPQPDQSVDFDKTDNVFIEGENLEVLKVLQKSYYGKVKMIYIDPPYNTGNDSFIYPDKFSETKDEYLRRIGDKDEAGYLTKEGFFRKNSKENGQYHSNWLSMMYPRLFLARNLLRDDGVIFVSIDDNEVHNLRLMMNEVFGEENFMASLVWEKIHSTKNDAKYFSENHEYVVCYAKDKTKVKIELLPRTDEMNQRYQNPDNDSRGAWSSGDLVANEERTDGHYLIQGPTGKKFDVPAGKHWVTTQENLEALIKDNRVWFGMNGDSFPRLKRFLSDVQQGRKASTLMPNEEVGHNQEATRETKAIFDDRNLFDTPKPSRLLERLLRLATVTHTEETVLDFFAGSGTTAQAVMELNREDGGDRNFILVQLPEKTDEDSEAYKAGYKSIADICRERINRAGEKVRNDKSKSNGLFEENDLDTGFKTFTLEPSNFKVWRTDTIENGDDLVEQLDAFADPVRSGSDAEAMAWEILIKSGYQLTARMDRIHVDSEKRGQGETEKGIVLYLIAGGEVILALEKISQKAIDEVVKIKPKTFICLDRLFAGNDQLKTNTALQLKDAGVEFRTI